MNRRQRQTAPHAAGSAAYGGWPPAAATPRAAVRLQACQQTPVPACPSVTKQGYGITLPHHANAPHQLAVGLDACRHAVSVLPWELFDRRDVRALLRHYFENDLRGWKEGVGSRCDTSPLGYTFRRGVLRAGAAGAGQRQGMQTASLAWNGRNPSPAPHGNCHVKSCRQGKGEGAERRERWG